MSQNVDHLRFLRSGMDDEATGHLSRFLTSGMDEASREVRRGGAASASACEACLQGLQPQHYEGGQQNSGATKTAQPEVSEMVEDIRVAHGPDVDGPRAAW